MSIARNILDHVLRGLFSEARFRRDHPCDTAELFAWRKRYWEERGRPVLARIAERREQRWRERCGKR